MNNDDAIRLVALIITGSFIMIMGLCMIIAAFMKFYK